MTPPNSSFQRCALCERTGVGTTRHHLIPRMKHRSRRTRRLHDLERRRETVDLCRPCHTQVHATLSEKQLADSFNTIEALISHPEIQRFVGWIRSKPADLRVRSSPRSR
ncbi:MAG: hypothetical protein H6819_07170 [Phycisphaerales bacterium]|nr:hypothetical protein [Phycisphaerales bacterium]MCB9857725.1 hypothetical protein [Phycisphaerales bacterium]MCB9863785.1 hypothetical protein [Phycisphaerales bacterium]